MGSFVDILGSCRRTEHECSWGGERSQRVDPWHGVRGGGRGDERGDNRA